MARCACGNAACSCVIKGKPDGGIVVTGSGSPERPYEISTVAGGNPLDSLTVSDTATLDLTMVGAGTPEDKRRISGTVIAKIRDLTDVSKTDTPVVGDVIQWNGTEWVFAGPGATAVPVSGIWGTAPLDKSGSDSTIGLDSYIDSTGKLRIDPHVLASASRVNADPITAYPLGVTLLSVFTPDGSAGGWPMPVSAHVTTFHRIEASPPHNSGYQIWTRNTSVNPQQMIRVFASGVWSPWTFLGGLAPHYAAYKAASQALTTINTSYTITYDSVVTNVGGITYAGGVFTVPQAGDYLININQHLQRSATTTFTGYLYQNAAVIANQSYALSANANVNVSKTVRCAANDTLKWQLRASVAGGIAYGASTPYSTIDLTLVGG